MATTLPSYDWPSSYRVTVGTSATSITLPARPGTVRIFNATAGSIVFVEVSGATATVPVAGGAPGSMPLGGGPGTLPLVLEKGNSTSISLIGSQANIDVHIQCVFGSNAISQTRSLLSAALDLVFSDPGQTTLDPRITFTRASAATRFNSAGLLETLTNDQPRFDYDPATPAGTTGSNLVTNSTFDSVSGWTLNAGAAYWTISGGQLNLTAPDGTAAYADNTESYPLITTGKTYQIDFDIIGTAASAGVVLRGTTVSFVGGGHKTITATAGSSVAGYGLRFISSGVASYGIDNVVVKEVTFNPRGLLIEEARTNLYLNSKNLTQATWTLGATTVNATVVVTPDGASSSTNKLVEDATTNTHAISNTGTLVVSASSPVTISVFAKAAERNYCVLQINDGTSSNAAYCMFNLTTGAVTVAPTLLVGSLTGMSASAVSVGNGWWRLSFAATLNTVANAIGYLGISTDGTTRSYAGTAGSGIYLWGAQAEAGAFPTSYIPTTTASASRSADSALMTGTNFSSWYNQTAGTFVAEGYYALGFPTTNPQSLTVATDGTAANRIFLRRNAAGGVSDSAVVVASVFQTVAEPGTVMAQGAVAKMGIAYAAASTTIAANGTAGAASGAISIPTLSQMEIGSGLGGAYLNGHIRRIAYYKARLPDSALQALTT